MAVGIVLFLSLLLLIVFNQFKYTKIMSLINK